MPSPILARADALMQRRSPAGGERDDVPVLTEALEPAPAAGDDIPVLCDAEPAAHSGRDRPAAAPLDEAALRHLAHDIERRLIAELPRLVDTALREALARR